MNEEFHYYAIRHLASAADLEPELASTIAHASARVDRALQSWEILDLGGKVRSEVTQDYLFWNEGTARDIYLPFHFVPGDRERAAAERRSAPGGATDPGPYVVTPDSPLAKALLVGALRSEDPFRIGIALHAYADSWAHQQFTGRLEAANELGSGSPLPPVGHLQALRAPDDAAGRWEDTRLRPELARVRNAERFLAAARKIYRYLRTWRRSSFADEELALAPLERLWTGGSWDREARLASFVVDLGVEPPDHGRWTREAGIPEAQLSDPGYDQLRRFTQGLGSRLLEPRPADTGGRYANSELARWDAAARAHRSAALRLYREAGLDPGEDA